MENAKKKTQSAEAFFGDFELAQTKASHVLDWVKRRAREGFDGDTRPFIGREPSFELIGDRQHLLTALYGTVGPLHSAEQDTGDRAKQIQSLLDSIIAQVVAGGATNIAVRIRSESSESLGLFVKIGLPHARWQKKKKCPLSRFDREVLGLNRLNAICPGVTSRPVMCGFDEVVDDGIRYLVIECLPLHFEKFLFQFQRGNVDPRPARALGFVLAKLHVQSPSRFNGKSGILNEEIQTFLAYGHYKKTADTLQVYLKHNDFYDPEVQKNFMHPIVPAIAQKHSSTLKTKPDIVRAISRHWENYHNPPQETASLVHCDSHVINILVSTNETTYPYSVDDEEYDPGKENLMKLIDMEFSNWGPAGADLGMFSASALFYALVHSYNEEAVIRSDTIIDSISECWRAYRKSYIRYARLLNRTDESIALSLYRIVYEAIGWAGFWIFRFTSPSLFPNICCGDFLYPLPQGLEVDLASRSLSGENGLELLRYAINSFAVESVIVGFGDETMEMLGNDRNEERELDASNRVMNTFLNDLTAKRNELYTLLERAAHDASG